MLMLNVAQKVGELRRMTVGELRREYAAVFGEQTRSYHKEFLVRRIAWRMQANAEGGLPERARQRALEIADDADLRLRAPGRANPGAGLAPVAGGQVVTERVEVPADARLAPSPVPGFFRAAKTKGDVERSVPRLAPGQSAPSSACKMNARRRGVEASTRHKLFPGPALPSPDAAGRGSGTCAAPGAARGCGPRWWQPRISGQRTEVGRRSAIRQIAAGR
jgi:hypothetical protein